MNRTKTPTILDDRALRGRLGVFEDRREAGEQLARLLKEYRTHESIVVGIPAGGLLVAAVVAEILHLPLDLVAVSCIRPSWSNMIRYGVVGAHGSPLFAKDMTDRTSAANREIENAVRKARSHANARAVGFGRSVALPDMAGRQVLLVDDGIEEGLTMCAALEELRSWNVSRVVVAAATGSRCGTDRIENVDAIVCPNIRTTQPFHESDSFRHLDNLTDSEVMDVLS